MKKKSFLRRTKSILFLLVFVMPVLSFIFAGREISRFSKKIMDEKFSVGKVKAQGCWTIPSSGGDCGNCTSGEGYYDCAPSDGGCNMCDMGDCGTECFGFNK